MMDDDAVLREWRGSLETRMKDKEARINMAAIAKRINAAYARGERDSRKALLHYRDAGRELREAKERLKHGEFGEWVERNTKLSWRRANECMQVARDWRDLKLAESANLTEALLRIKQEGIEPIELSEETEWTEDGEYVVIEPSEESQDIEYIEPSEESQERGPQYLKVVPPKVVDCRRTKISSKQLMAEQEQALKRDIEQLLDRYLDWLPELCESIRKAAGIGSK
jgi:hypothetical protein